MLLPLRTPCPRTVVVIVVVVVVVIGRVRETDGRVWQVACGRWRDDVEASKCYK
jgi:hypothetical protein